MLSRSLTGDEWWRALPLGATGDAVRILVARGVRAFGDGYVTLLLPIYLVDLGFGTLAIGAIVTSTLIGTALLTLWIGWIANRYSRRLLLIARRYCDSDRRRFCDRHGFLASPDDRFCRDNEPDVGGCQCFCPG